MDVTDSPLILARKIAAHRPGAAEVFSPDRALFTAFAREAERKLQLPLLPVLLTDQQRTGAEIAETLPEHALIALLDGPGDTTGLVVLDPGTLSALTEMMTIGQLGRASPARRPTRTDAALVAGLLDAALAGFDQMIAADPCRVWGAGFRYAAHLADARPLGLILDEPGYRCLSLDLAFGGEPPEGQGRQGRVTLAFPARGRGHAPDKAGNQSGLPPADHAEDAALFSAALGRVVDAVTAEVTAVLARVTLPLADFLALETGQSLTLPLQAVARIQVEGADGRLICLAELGQGNGQRALRLDLHDGLADPPIAPPVGGAQIVAASDQPLLRAPAPSERAAAPHHRRAPDMQEILARSDPAAVPPDQAAVSSDDASGAALARTG